MKKKFVALSSVLLTLFVLMINSLYVEANSSDGINIKGYDHEIPSIVTLPEMSDTPVPVVILLHGTASNKDEAGNGYVELSNALAKSGIASIRFDFAGSGDSSQDYIDYSVISATKDTLSVIDYIYENKDKFDVKKIGLLGWSQGGYIALLTAGLIPNEINSLVTWAGTTDMSNSVSDEQYDEAREHGYFIREYDWREDTKVSLDWILQMRSINLLDAFKDYSGPVLALHGTEDTVVPIAEAEKIVAANGNEKSKFISVEGADHTFNIFTDDHSEFEELINQTIKWFEETMF